MSVGENQYLPAHSAIQESRTDHFWNSLLTISNKKIKENEYANCNSYYNQTC